MLKRMCEDDEEALRLLREETTGDPGGDQRSEDVQTIDDNINNGRSAGTSKDYTLDRLAREDAGRGRSVRCEAVDGRCFRLDAVPGVPGNNPAKRARVAAGRFVVERKADGGLVQVQIFGHLRLRVAFYRFAGSLLQLCVVHFLTFVHGRCRDYFPRCSGDVE